MKRFLKRVRTAFCSIKYKKSCQVDLSAYLNEKCCFEGNNRIERRTLLYSSEMGYGSYIGNDGFFVRVKIGRYCSIGDGVKVVNITHPIDGVSTHPAFYSSKYGGFSYVNQNKAQESLSTEAGWYCEIGNDVWIGNDVLIKGGVKIGDGAVVAMGAVVTKDVPPYAVVGGTPARIIKYRFDDEIKDALMELRWWDKDEAWIKAHADLFMDVDKLLEKTEE